MDKINDKYLKILYKLAYKAYKKGEIPVGSIIIYNNKIIGMGYNNKESNNNVCGHAEINAITKASKYMKDWRLNECMLLTTLKPCEMCNEVIKASRIKDVYYLLDQNNLTYTSANNNTPINAIDREKNEENIKPPIEIEPNQD